MMKTTLRLLAAVALLCAPFAAHAQTAYGTTDYGRNTCVVDITVSQAPSGQTTTKAACAALIDAATGLPYTAGGGGGASSTSVKSSNQACTSSAVALPNKAHSSGFIIKAKATNTGNINVGGLTTEAPTASSGTPLAPGEATSAGATNSNMVSIICATGGSGSVDVFGN